MRSATPTRTEESRQRTEWKSHIGILCVLCGLVWPPRAVACEIDGRYMMGTVLQVTVCDTGPIQHPHVFDTVFTETARLEALFTTFSAHSPVSRLNARAGQGPQPVPSAVADILSLSLQYWQLTEGTFDITVGPLMALWQRAAEAQRPPSEAIVQQTRTRVGSEKIQLSPHGTVSLARHDMAIDLGGIGKGYALDQAVAILRKRGIKSALLNFGQSSLWPLGHPPDAPGWRLLVRHPNGAPAGLVTVSDKPFSVSGSFGQRLEITGRQYGHVIDPRTGEPLQRDLLACVVAPSAAQAEALSKALLILGEHEGISLLERLPGVEGLLIAASGQRWMTTHWTQVVTFVSL